MNLCVICSQENYGYQHFGARVCAACSAFFRRSIAEQKIYRCNKENRCEIKEDQRNSCRACRLQKCLNSGMSMEGTQNSLNDFQMGEVNNSLPIISAESSSTTISYPQSFASSISFDLCIQYPISYKLLNGFKNYLNSQKSLVTIAKFEKNIRPDELAFIKKSEYDKLEIGCMSLINSMLNNFFEPYSSLNQEQKIRLLKSFSMKFACMCKCYLTSKHFPDSNDTRCMMTYGYFVDINDIKYFMSENEKKTEIAPLYASVLKQARQLAHKFVQQEISEIDIAALAYMIYSLESEKLLLPMEIVKINKDRLFQELLHYYAIDKGFEHGVVKYSNLLFLIHDIIDLYNHVHEYFTLSKIFDPNFLYVWEDSC